MKLSGHVRFRDLETGVWVFEGDDGNTYLLDGGDRKIKKDGARIEAEGTVNRNVFTTAMVGPTFVVKSYRFI